MKTFKFVLSAFFTFVAGVANAGTWTPPVDIEVAYAHTGYGGYGVYQISDTSINPDGCDTTWYVVSKTNNLVFSEIYALMLAAYTSGKQVRLFIDGCSPHNHPEIQHVKTVE